MLKRRYYTAIALGLASAVVHAAEEVAQSAPAAADADPTGFIVFTLLFVGGLGWMGWMMWKNNKTEGHHGKQSHSAK